MTSPTRIAARITLAAPRAEADGVRRLLAAFRARGADAEACTPTALAARHAAAAAQPGAQPDAPPDAPPDLPPERVLCRMASGRPAWEMSALLACERRGLAFVDPPSRLLGVHDKALLLASLAAAGVPVPPTLCVTRGAPPDLSSLPGSRFVVKPVTGAAGRGVTPGLDRDAATRAAAAFADLSGPVLVQPRLGDGRDLRLWMLDGQPLAAMARHPRAGDGRGNLNYGATAEVHEPADDELAAARAAVAVTGLVIAAVDLLRDDEGRAWVLEVNTCPGFHGIEALSGRDLAGRVADHVLERAAPSHGRSLGTSAASPR